jgi:signal transduction histidine kinase
MTTAAETAGDAVLELLRAISRDVAHELRGPVQAVVVNAEVARRKLAAGDADGVAERIDILESEVRRLHGMTNAFLALIRPAPAERRSAGIDALLAETRPLLDALARAAHAELRHLSEGDDGSVRVRTEPLALALTSIVAAQCAAAGPQGTVTLLRRAAPTSVDLVVTPEPAPAAPGTANAPVPAPAPGDAGADTIRAAQAWIAAEDGTVEAVPGSDPGRPGVRIRLPRADMA